MNPECTVGDRIAAGYQARRDGRLEEARQLFAWAVADAIRLPDRTILASALAGAGQIERDLHQHAAAVECYLKAAAIYRAVGDSLRVAHTIRHAADVLRARDEVRAELLYTEALGIYRAHAETPALDLANAIRGFALLSEHTGKRENARELWQEARVLYESAGVQAGVDESESHIAGL